MPFLMVGGVPVPVALTGGSLKWIKTGDISPAIDGSNRGTVIAQKRVLDVPTRPMSVTDAALLRAALQSASTSASGDWIGATITVIPTLTEETPVATGSTHRLAFRFTLTEE
jgi:hypothetical protein